MPLKSRPSRCRDAKTRVGLSPDERLPRLDELFLLKSLEVAREIAVGDIEESLQRIEIHCLIDGQYGHDSKPHAALKRFLQSLDYLFHFSYLTWR